MTPAQRLQNVSTALFGFWSPSLLGKALNVSERTVRRWGEGSSIPDGVWADLRTVCITRADDLDVLSQSL